MGNCNWINNNTNPYTTNTCTTNTCNTNPCPTGTCNTPSNNGCCCCPESMKKALGLISNSPLADYIDFTSFAFVLSNLSVGGYLDTTIPGTGVNAPDDNLVYDTTPATFQCVECNLVKITTTGAFVPGTAVAITDVNYVSLCDLAVVKFAVDEELFATPTAATNECYPACNISSWASFKSYFRSLLDKKVYGDNCQCCSDDCCCENDILNKVNACVAGSRGPAVSLIANEWAGEGLEVLGRIGCVLVLTDNNNATDSPDLVDPNIFFVCADKIGAFLV